MSVGSVLIAAVAAAAVSFGQTGMRPRPVPEDYPAHQAGPGFSLGAAALTPDQVKKQFAADLNRGYVVIEVAVFPTAGQSMDLAARDFMAKFGSSSDIERPLTAQAIAAHLGTRKPPRLDSPTTTEVYASETIGVAHTPNGREVYSGTSAGLAAGVPTGAPPVVAPPAGTDPASIKAELVYVGLPEQSVAQPVAGYLYFARPGKGKSGPIQLTYYGMHGRTTLTIPAK